MNKKYTQKALDNYRKILVAELKRELNKKGSRLENSIVGRKIPNKDGFRIKMNDYGVYESYGVNGKRSAYTSPFSYKSKYPNIDRIKDWIVRNNVQPRTFSSTKKTELEDLAFLISRSIYQNGIRPTRFIDIAIEKVEPKMTKEIVDAYGKDLSEELDKMTLNASSKN
jgi:hypothetical protein